MNIILFKQYSTISAIIAIYFATTFFFTLPIVLSTFVFFSYFFIMSWIYGSVLTTQKDSSPHPVYILGFGALIVGSLFPLILTPIYWFFGYIPVYSYLIALLILLISIILVYAYDIPYLQIKYKKNDFKPTRLVIFLIPIIGLSTLLVRLFQKQTSDTIFSPWTYIGPTFFLFTTVTIFFALFALKKLQSKIAQYSILFLWYLFVYSIIFFIYTYAFGFDQHIHLASMNWIVENKLIEPKVPYYLGQYFFAIPFAELSQLSLDWVSRSIVPLFTATILPFLLLFSQKKVSAISLFFLPLLPIGFLTFTTPHNFALLLALFVIILLSSTNLHTQDRRQYLLIGLLTAWCTITHALIGIPLIAIVGLWIVKKPFFKLFFLFCIVFSIPLLLYFYGGGTMLVFEPMSFISLFGAPHWYIGTTTSIFWNSIYIYKQYIPLVITSIIGIGVWHFWRERIVRLLLLTAASTTVASFLIAAIVRFPALISYEQHVYAKRLLDLTLVLLIPLFIRGLHVLYQKISTKKEYSIAATFIAIPLLLISLYFTYPTRDAISYYTGVSIRDADVTAITFIEEEADDAPYIVLTNQTISAAALSNFGYNRYIDTPSGSKEYFYAIPTGGPLYEYFREYLYEGYNKKSIIAAMDFAGVDQAYVIHTNYWAPAAEIRDISKSLSNQWWEFGNGRVWVYQFNR